ncbi:MAG: molybdopterin-dependent oxidoreductase, partial [Pseudomonadota bacterium]|nr:molybdopterin-dependent oxidoreductase [Pseudomonadota bacterium]
MLFKEKKGWEIPEQRITDEAFFKNRRDLIKCIGGTTGLLAATAIVPAALASQNTGQKYRAIRNERYTFSRPLTDEFDATTYNNFYEFGSHKSIYKAAQALKTSPWSITIDGLVDNPKKLDWDDLLSQLPIEERVYRHRCVEAWSMIVPWIGFPLSSLISLVKPLSNAKYIVLETIMDKDAMPGLRQH